MARILLADGQVLVRELVTALLLGMEGDFAVAETGSLVETLGTISASGPFDLVVIDAELPGLHGLRGFGRAIDASTPAPVALLTGNPSNSLVTEALRMGAAGCIPKTLPSRSFINAVNFLLAGETYLPPSVVTATIEDDGMGLIDGKLTPREKAVLRGLVDGRSNKEIAIALHLSLPTVKTHVRSICKKLGADNRTHAVVIARHENWF
ncbi:MAG: response regulator [Limimaricola sp.]|uniref:response regulator transcription factor n=1 Tax=Limimaricola sp. TaxID=2211665 RepID=UPI001D9C5376|nr:response regulator transcription factor [Limimaricola sp.]MBI1417969.1 response regulator [Limimaricola sp.]